MFSPQLSRRPSVTGSKPPGQATMSPPPAPPDPFGGTGGDPFGPSPAGGPAQPPSMDPFGGGAAAPLGPPPGMPKPGQGMDPMQAMLNGIGPDPLGAGPPPQQGPPLGPGGLPVGGSLPQLGGDDGDPSMDGSGLLQALAGALSAPPTAGDPYGVAPFQPSQGFEGMGTGDPGMGQEQLMQMLALAQLGIGGGPGAGSSGVDVGPFGNLGQMVGF
jgi:hypothetical protein